METCVGFGEEEGLSGRRQSLAQLKESPEEVTQEHLDLWIRQRTNRRGGHLSAQRLANAFWRVLIVCGYMKNAPVALLRSRYGIPLSEFPEPLKGEVTEVLRWKCADFEPERPKRAQIRETSAINIKEAITRLYGFATRIAGFDDINSLEKLIQKPIIVGFISWCINERKVKGGPLVPQLAAVVAAYRNIRHTKQWM